MACILGRMFFAGEDMSQMCAAVIADNFGPLAVAVRDSSDGARYFVVEAGPAAAGVEFIG